MATAVAELAVTAAEALAVAQADAVIAYRGELSRFRIEITREPDGWRVVYHFVPAARFETGGGPHYLISLDTGAILDKKYYQ